MKCFRLRFRPISAHINPHKLPLLFFLSFSHHHHHSGPSFHSTNNNHNNQPSLNRGNLGTSRATPSKAYPGAEVLTNTECLHQLTLNNPPWSTQAPSSPFWPAWPSRRPAFAPASGTVTQLANAATGAGAPARASPRPMSATASSVPSRALATTAAPWAPIRLSAPRQGPLVAARAITGTVVGIAR